MMEKCPNATLYVHSRGARHMIDPTKLILGAKAVYKEDFDKLFRSNSSYRRRTCSYCTTW